MPTPPELHEHFVRDVLANPDNRAILDRWDRLGLPDGWLVAGCLFQAAWNVATGQPAGAHVKDHDLFYFDAGDLSEAGERRAQSRVDDVLADLGVVVEAKNQARVHLWYEAHFGYPCPRLASVKDGIDRFLVLSTCVGVRPGGASLEVYAPNGLHDLYGGRLAPNPLTDHRPLFAGKALSYVERWPWLRIDGGAAA